MENRNVEMMETKKKAGIGTWLGMVYMLVTYCIGAYVVLMTIVTWGLNVTGVLEGKFRHVLAWMFGLLDVHEYWDLKEKDLGKDEEEYDD